MKSAKESIRVVSKVIAGIAGVIFLFAPMRGFGPLWVVGAIFVAILSMGAYKWGEPDEDQDEPAR